MTISTINVDETLAINPPGVEPVLTRDQVWEGLQMKAHNALPFVPRMSRCEVLKEYENGLLREIQFDGMPLKERIIYYPKDKVEFIRVGFGDEMGTIWNEILEDEDGALMLRFAFELAVLGLSPEEAKDYQEKRATGYLHAVPATIDHLRKLSLAGEI